jgi:hydrogenase/urease accessory protein HupE
VLALLLGFGPAAAHTVGKGLATITVSGQSVQYHLLLAVTATPQTSDLMELGAAGGAPDYGLLLAAVEDKVRIASSGRPCQTAARSVAPPAQESGNAVVQLQFTCAQPPTELTIRDDLVDVLGASYHTIANIQWPGGSQQHVFLAQQREVHVSLSAGQTARGAGSFFALGVEHILIGFDHLLFLLALVLRGGRLWSLLKIVTAFTIAHSITLALAALDVVNLPSRLVEATIALSIAYVAAENLFLRQTVSHRWAVSFLFGLVHGFGFSSVLRELGLPTEGLVWSLLSFNLGVEAGQALAVAVALPLLLALRRTRWDARVTATVSVVVLVVGLTLFVDRTWIET